MVGFDLVVWCSSVGFIASYFVILLSRMVGCERGIFLKCLLLIWWCSVLRLGLLLRTLSFCNQEWLVVIWLWKWHFLKMVVIDLVVWCSLVVYVASYFVSLLSRMVGCDLVVNLVFFKNGWLWSGFESHHFWKWLVVIGLWKS